MTIMVLLSDGTYRSTEREYKEGQQFLVSVGGKQCYATVVGVAKTLEDAAQLANSAEPILKHFYADQYQAADEFRMELIE